MTSIAALAAPAASAAPITFHTALPVTAGDAIVRLQAQHVAFARDPTPLARELEVEALVAVGAFGVTPRLALFAVVPLLDKELQVATPEGRATRGDSGLADVALLARWTAWQRDTTGETFRFAPFAGVELPSGEDDAADARGRLPAPLQLGSGSWDAQGGLVLSRQTLAWEADAALSYQANTEANGFERGDVAHFDLSYQRRLWPRALGRGVPAYLYAVLESNWIWQERDRENGRALFDSGGTTWLLVPGLQYVTRRWVVEAAVQLPAAQDPNGTALESDWTGTLSVRFNL